MEDRTPRALVADDDAGIRVLVTRILTRNGFTVDSVRDGAEAIEHLMQNTYDVIALDLMMPRMDGFTVADYLQRHKPEVLDRVIVMTAFGSAGVERIRPMVRSFMEKPFEVGSLAREALAILERGISD